MKRLINNGEECKGNTCGPHGFLSVLRSNGYFPCFESFDAKLRRTMFVLSLHVSPLQGCSFLSIQAFKKQSYHPSIQKAESYLLVNLLVHPLSHRSQIILVLLLPSSSQFSQRLAFIQFSIIKKWRKEFCMTLLLELSGKQAT